MLLLPLVDLLVKVGCCHQLLSPKGVASFIDALLCAVDFYRFFLTFTLGSPVLKCQLGSKSCSQGFTVILYIFVLTAYGITFNLLTCDHPWNLYSVVSMIICCPCFFILHGHCMDGAGLGNTSRNMYLLFFILLSLFPVVWGWMVVLLMMCGRVLLRFCRSQWVGIGFGNDFGCDFNDLGGDVDCVVLWCLRFGMDFGCDFGDFQINVKQLWDPLGNVKA